MTSPRSASRSSIGRHRRHHRAAGRSPVRDRGGEVAGRAPRSASARPRQGHPREPTALPSGPCPRSASDSPSGEGPPMVPPSALTDPWTLGGLPFPTAWSSLRSPASDRGRCRLQAERHGAWMAVSEMVSSHAVYHGNPRTCTEMLRIHPGGAGAGPTSIQLFGADPQIMRSAAAGSPRPAPTSSTSTWAAPCRRSARPARAQRCWPIPPGRSRSPARRARGAACRSRSSCVRGAPGDRAGVVLAHGSSRTPAWWPSRSIRAMPPSTTGAGPTTSSPPSSWQRCRCR